MGESGEIPLTYYHNNVTATILLASVMSEYDCPRMVYSSSATVYGIPPVIPIPETTPLRAESVYGNTKVVCETILKDLCICEYSYCVLSLLLFIDILFSISTTRYLEGYCLEILQVGTSLSQFQL